MASSDILLGEMSRERVRELAPQATLVIPVAAIEQHGPDLPISVDQIICATVAEQAARQAAGEATLIVAPIVAYGYSPHHFPYPGVFSLQAETLLAVLRDLGGSAVASGFRRVFFLNGHGGNDDLVRMAAREIGNAHDCLAGAASYWTLALPALERLVAAQGIRVPGHAGDFEASIIQALRPELVDTVRPAPHKGAATGPLPDTNVAAFTQIHNSMQRIGGYTDRSARVSATLGRELLDVVVTAVSGSLVAFHRAAG